MQKSKAIKIKLKITHVVFRSKRTCFMQGSLRAPRRFFRPTLMVSINYPNIVFVFNAN
jgi:hypothetical protein